MPVTRSLCIAMAPLYRTQRSGRKRAPALVPVSSSFEIVRGVKTNRVREHARDNMTTHRNPLRRRSTATGGR